MKYVVSSEFVILRRVQCFTLRVLFASLTFMCAQNTKQYLMFVFPEVDDTNYGWILL